MTRRSALQVLGVVAGALTQNLTTTQTWDWKPVGLRLVLGQWKDIVVEFNGERVVIDPKEMFDALKSGGAPHGQ